MDKITGSANITLGGVSIAPPRPPHTYLGVAQALMPAVRTLADQPSPPGIAVTLLAAHMLECLLKAFLSRAGNDDDLKSAKIRHNLNGLWAAASAGGLEIPAAIPPWVDRLSELHDRPYQLRYSTGVHGVVTPAPIEMAVELEKLLDAIGKRL